jgi:hypothetical protein
MAKLKRYLPLLGIVLVALIVFALFQMGIWPFGGSDADSQATVTTQHTAKTGGSGSTATSAARASTAEDQAKQYLADLETWQSTYWSTVDLGAFTFKKPTKPTAAEVERAQATCDKQTASVTALRLIMAPVALSGSHASYVAAIDGEAKAGQRVMRAIKNKNWRDVELAMRTMDAARALEVKTVEDIEDYVAQFDPAASTTTTTERAATTTTSTSTTAPAK